MTAASRRPVGFAKATASASTAGAFPAGSLPLFLAPAGTRAQQSFDCSRRSRCKDCSGRSATSTAHPQIRKPRAPPKPCPHGKCVARRLAASVARRHVLGQEPSSSLTAAEGANARIAKPLPSAPTAGASPAGAVTLAASAAGTVPVLWPIWFVLFVVTAAPSAVARIAPPPEKPRGRRFLMEPKHCSLPHDVRWRNCCA